MGHLLRELFPALGCQAAPAADQSIGPSPSASTVT
jgi:hypothetical protein